MNGENLIQLIYDDMQEVKRLQVITNKRLDGMDRRFDSLEARVLDNTEEIKKVNLRLENHTEEIRKINLCLENEIRPSIMRIAEGHLDLNRKLDEALKIDKEKEKIVLRLNFLEGKVERLESKVAGLA